MGGSARQPQGDRSTANCIGVCNRVCSRGRRRATMDSQQCRRSRHCLIRVTAPPTAATESWAKRVRRGRSTSVTPRRVRLSLSPSRHRRGGRAAECSGLKNRRRPRRDNWTPPVGSNPTLSARRCLRGYYSRAWLVKWLASLEVSAIEDADEPSPGRSHVLHRAAVCRPTHARQHRCARQPRARSRLLRHELPYPPLRTRPSSGTCTGMRSAVRPSGAGWRSAARPS